MFFGLATLRAGVFLPVAALGLVAVGLIAFRSSFPPYGVPLGLVVAAAGPGSSGRTGPR